MTEVTPAEAHQLIDRLARLLRDEIAAIGQGELGRVEGLRPRKEDMLAEIEAKLSDTDGVFGEDQSARASMGRKLDALRDLLATDLALLRRMTEATGDVAREIERIRARQSLGGLYDREGSRQGAPVAPTKRFDQSV